MLIPQLRYLTHKSKFKLNEKVTIKMMKALLLKRFQTETKVTLSRDSNITLLQFLTKTSDIHIFLVPC
jgi:hypothetical protein